MGGYTETEEDGLRKFLDMFASGVKTRSLMSDESTPENVGIT